MKVKIGCGALRPLGRGTARPCDAPPRVAASPGHAGHGSLSPATGRQEPQARSSGPEKGRINAAVPARAVHERGSGGRAGLRQAVKAWSRSAVAWWTGGGLLEVEGEAVLWGPYVSEWRKREAVGYFGSYGRCVYSSSLTVGLGSKRRRKWQESGRQRFIMANFTIDEL